MDFLEKDLENIIWESNNDELLTRGLRMAGKRFRQVRIGNYGVADLVTIERSQDIDFINEIKVTKGKRIVITVYELKKDKIGISAFLQAVGYVRGIQRYLEKRDVFPDSLIEYNICLIGRSVDDSGNFAYLPDLFFNDIENDVSVCFIRRPMTVKFYKYNYKIDGLFFENISDYKLIEEGF